MMSKLILHTKYEFNVPIEIRRLKPERIAGKDINYVKNLPAWEGNRRVTLKQLFDIEGSEKLSENLNEIEIEINGKGLRRVRYLGYKMRGGKIVINGDVGPLTGYKMRGGTIIIRGNADNYLGAKMRGGYIEVYGNASNFIGSKLLGEKPGKGMISGKIIIHGNAGSYIGNGMRGGEIIIEGNAKDYVGMNMKGGLIWIKGSCGLYPGARMIAGRIVVMNKVEDILPSFYIDDITPMIKVKGQVIDKPFATFIGDVIVRGVGRLQISYRDN
ncbi:MAG: formylmethanofuran dehydrogenase subunit C, partial [Thermoprotei archaeon ex4572_64]